MKARFPTRDYSWTGPLTREVMSQMAGRVRQFEADLSERDRQVQSLTAEVKRLTAKLSREERKSPRRPTLREKRAGQGA